ncbi:polysaccharide deacetylase family protein [Sphaerisporangium rhizosphaerae]|uniref:Polysaccharide deacetylase family protein n=1 Tax=Sphaerisporangium rhizosphaerae TaxID=2269375 RepID=A0ABW2NW15_9ACTN
MSRLPLAGGVAAVIAITAGCGMAMPFSSPDLPATLPAQPTTINFVDPASIPGLAVHTTSDDSADRHVFAGYPAPASAPALGERLRQVTAAAVRRFAATPGARRGAAGPSELNIGWQVTAASGGVFGVRLRTGTFTGGTWRTSLATYWYDGADGRVHDSADLVKDARALDTLATVVRARLGTFGPGITAGAVRPDRTLFDSLNFNPHGDLVAEFDDGRVAPARMGRIAVAVPGHEAAGLLSDLGRRVMKAVDAATPPTLAASPPPEYSPSPGDDDADNGGGGASGAGGGSDCSVTKCVALTFDDGPGPRTGPLLSILARYGARATFFALGPNAEARPDLLRRIAAAGDLIANHSWTHRDLTTMDVHRISDELDRTQIAAGIATGRAPRLMRAPYGDTDAKVAAAARALNLSIVGWSVDTADARDPDPRAVARRAVDGARPGSIILMHEAGAATARALPLVLTGLEKKGYAFVTVPELYGSRHMGPGQVYAGADPPPRRARTRRQEAPATVPDTGGAASGITP